MKWLLRVSVFAAPCVLGLILFEFAKLEFEVNVKPATAAKEQPVVEAMVPLPPILEELVKSQAGIRNHRFVVALRRILEQQVVHCDGKDQPERVEASVEKLEDGSESIHLKSPGRHGYGDRIDQAVRLRDGKIVSLSFLVISAFDSCPCESNENPVFFDNTWLDTVTRINTLEVVNLANTRVTSAGLKFLARLPQLRTLNLHESRVKADGIPHLAKLQQLEALELPRLSHFMITAGLKDLAACTNLRSLSIPEARMDQGSVDALWELKHLEELSLNGVVDAAETDIIFTDSETSSRLRELNLSLKGQFGRVVFQNLKTIQSIYFHRTQTAGSTFFRSIPNLISLSFNAFSAEPKVGIHGLPQLENMSIHMVDGLPNVDGDLPSLKQLSVYGHRNPGAITKLSPRFPNLETMTLYARWGDDPSQPVNARDLERLSKLTKLRLLHVRNVQLEDFKPIEAMSQLETVRLLDARINDVDGITLTHPRLKVFRITGFAPGRFEVRSCPKLKNLMWTAFATQGTFVDTPELIDCLIDGTHKLEHLDFSKSGIADWDKMDLSINDRRKTDVVPPESYQVAEELSD